MIKTIRKIKRKTRQYIRVENPTLLRTVLLFGAVCLFCIQAVALQLPDGFNYVEPAIGDGQWYYIQLCKSNDSQVRSYLTEMGDGEQLRSTDYMPFAENRLWTLEAAEVDGEFYLKSKSGLYAYWDAENSKLVVSSTDKYPFTLYKRTNVNYPPYGKTDFYEISIKNSSTTDERGMNRSKDWVDIGVYNRKDVNNALRFAQLKSNAAHIIYYRKEGADNSTVTNIGTRYYLTNSGTDDPNTFTDNRMTVEAQAVSARRSILRNDKGTWTMPTAGAYHQDGMWTIEQDGDNIKIKKYGTEEYLAVKNNPTKGGGSECLYAVNLL